MSSNDNVTTKEIELPDGYVLRITSSTGGTGVGFGAAGIVVPADKAVAGASEQPAYESLPVGFPSNYESQLPVGFPSGCGASHVDTQQGFHRTIGATPAPNNRRSDDGTNH